LSGHLFQGRYKALPVSPEEEGYFLQVSSYIHLNPVRANLVGPKADSLASYAWSSYPEYLKPRSRRREWIAVSRVLGELGLEDTRSGRRAYAAHLEGLRTDCRDREGRAEMESTWNKIRRGWYLGSDTFGERIRDLVGGVVDGKARDSYAGEERAAHDEAAAEMLLHTGLNALNVRREALKTLPESDPQKQVLAWWIRKQTAVGNSWISGHLEMGHPENLSGMVKQVERDPTRDMKTLKKQVQAK
jgi:hypothetical protein